MKNHQSLILFLVGRSGIHTPWAAFGQGLAGLAMSVPSRRDFMKKGPGVGKHGLCEETASQAYFLECGRLLSLGLPQPSVELSICTCRPGPHRNLLLCCPALRGRAPHGAAPPSSLFLSPTLPSNPRKPQASGLSPQ